MPLVLITGPSVEPVTLAELKAHLRISEADTAEDALLSTYVTSARLRAEVITKRQMVEATRELVLDAFPADGIIELPRPPLISVTSVKYVDTSGTQQILSTDYYDVDTDSEPGRVILAYGQSWPTTRDQSQAVRVRYDCGWALDDGSPTTPENLKLWIMIRVADWYEQRESFIPGMTQVATMPRDHVDGLLDPHTIPYL